MDRFSKIKKINNRLPSDLHTANILFTHLLRIPRIGL